MKISTLVLALSVTGLSSTVLAETPTRPLLTVSGEATISVAPDLAEIEGGVTSEAKTAREASDANNKAMTSVVAALKSAGIADADIRTSRLSLQPLSTQDRNNNGRMQITGYQAANRVTVRLRDLNRVAATIDTLVTAGANTIGGVNFMIARPSPLLDEARGRAIEDAKRKAEIYAKAAGVTLGPPVTISEEGGASPMPMRRMSVGMAAAPPPVSAGEETIGVTVSVAYEIRPAAQ